MPENRKIQSGENLASHSKLEKEKEKCKSFFFFR
jgi:hypothetical protein